MSFKGFKTQTRFKSTCHKSRDDAQENAEESIGEISNIFMAHVIFLNCKYNDIWCVGISYLFGMHKTNAILTTDFINILMSSKFQVP